MSDARKVLKKIGGRKKSSSRRRSPRKNRSHKRERWAQTAIAVLIAAVLIFVAYHLIFKKLFFRFAEDKTTTHLQLPTGVYGIDISRYQGKIDWEELKRNNPKETPIYFVYMKASEGKDLRDPRFKSNWKKAKEHGFIRGQKQITQKRTVGADCYSRTYSSGTDIRCISSYLQKTILPFCRGQNHHAPSAPHRRIRHRHFPLPRKNRLGRT